MQESLLYLVNKKNKTIKTFFVYHIDSFVYKLLLGV